MVETTTKQLKVYKSTFLKPKKVKVENQNCQKDQLFDQKTRIQNIDRPLEPKIQPKVDLV